MSDAPRKVSREALMFRLPIENDRNGRSVGFSHNGELSGDPLPIAQLASEGTAMSASAAGLIAYRTSTAGPRARGFPSQGRSLKKGFQDGREPSRVATAPFGHCDGPTLLSCRLRPRWHRLPSDAPCRIPL